MQPRRTKKRTPRLSIWAGTVLVLGGMQWAHAGVQGIELQPLDRIEGEYEAYIYAEGMRSPDGLDFHPVTGELYVAEEDAGRISVVRQGSSIPVIDDDWSVEDDLPQWAVNENKPRNYWLHDRLRSPEGLAFSPEGHLYVTEDIPDGRVLEFISDEKGRFKKARAIPVPWFYKGFAWEGITISADGRLFLAGSAAESGPSLFFGVVLMRDLNGDWWVVDYGPFAGFSSVSLSREQDILVVSEEVSGSITWWDTLRHRAVGTVQRSFPNLEGTLVLSDGSIAAAQESTSRSSDDDSSAESGLGGGRLIRINPKDGATRTLAEGFSTIECVNASPETGYLYVSENGTGLVIELRPKKRVQSKGYLLESTVRASEIATGLPPKKWPPFLKGFFRDLGINPRDEVVRTAEQGQSFDGPNSYTLVEVGEAIPLIAGQVHTQPSYRNGVNDPITDIDFIVLFPNRAVKMNGDATPGLSFFSARRASGEVDRTYSIERLKAYKFDSLQGWTHYHDNATMFLPTASCSVRPIEDGLDISLAFLSLGDGEDYYMHLTCGKENTGRLTVDSKSGMRASYGVDFTEETLDGAAYHTLVVAGFSETESDQPGWLNIGNWPLGYSISPEEKVPWTPHSANAGHPILEQLWEFQDASATGRE